MNKIGLYIVLSLIALKINAQIDSECIQLQKIIEFVKVDSATLKYFNETNIKLKINPLIDKNKGTPFLILEYYADKLELSEEQIKSDTSILHSIYRENQKYLLNTDSTYRLNCLFDFQTKRPNINIGFSRLDSTVVAVGISKTLRRKRRHTFGIYYIFLFERDNSIRKILKTEWNE